MDWIPHWNLNFIWWWICITCCSYCCVLICILFSVPWVHFVGDQKNQKVAALDDNDVTTCLIQDPKVTLLVKVNRTEFSSLAVVVVSNQRYPDTKQMCGKSLEHPWLLMTHVVSDRDATCDKFCGQLRSCIYGGIVNHSDTLFWHQMQCHCGARHCNQLALHILPHHLATLTICDILYI